MAIQPTIAALASGPQCAALAIIRISGPRSWEYTQANLEKKDKFAKALPGVVGLYVFKASKAASVAVDQVTAIKYRAPRSFTGEDMVEIFCHGSPFIAEKIISCLYKQGCIPAKPGEFSKRAYLNQKVSLIQAEAINSLIMSRSEAGQKNALFLYQGGYLPVLNDWKRQIKDILAALEGAIEFPLEDDFNLKKQERSIFIKINKLKVCIELEIQKRAKIKHLDNNFTVAIVGIPNAGKSSLFNRLLQFERAIVHHKAGTTRDTLSETIYIDNVPVTLIDTAGIHNSNNDVDNLGIKRTFSAIEKADLIIMVTAANEKQSKVEKEIFNDIITSKKPALGIINKTDLCSGKLKKVIFNNKLPSLSISLKKLPDNRVLFDFIKKNIIKHAQGEIIPSVFQNMRHEQIARNLQDELAQAIKKGTNEEVVAYHLKKSLELISEFFGTTTSEEILDSIFAKFCIGK